ncbi:MAG: hypothetical protein LIO77_04030, partial [Rikenellaceae bacterium]|nr:hypothetical protein [Rikenellaceae bacterium]
NKIDNSNLAGYISNGSNGSTKFSLANFGAAVNLYEGSGTLTSFTFGIGYNRLADYNTSNFMDIGRNGNSIAHVFGHQLNGTNPSDIDDFYRSPIDRQRYGAFLAYHTYLLDTEDGGATYKPFELSESALTNHMARIKTRGSIDEYNISGGFNVQNKFYFGFTIGLQDYSLRQEILYDEEYSNNNPASQYSPSRYLQYDQYMKMTGTGVNLKLGMVLRPTDALRIGVAVHTPTWSTVTYRYDTSLYYETEADGVGRGDSKSIYADDFEVDFSTPTKLMAGISYTFGQVGVISADYERAWYNSMRYRGEYRDLKGMNSVIRDEFQGNNTFRLGLEVRPTNLLSLRMGATYTDSALAIDTKRYAYDSPLPEEYYSGSFGIGYRIGRQAALDVAYVYSHTKYSPYYLYYDVDSLGEYFAGEISQKLTRNTVMATLSFRF